MRFSSCIYTQITNVINPPRNARRLNLGIVASYLSLLCNLYSFATKFREPFMSTMSQADVCADASFSACGPKSDVQSMMWHVGGVAVVDRLTSASEPRSMGGLASVRFLETLA